MKNLSNQDIVITGLQSWDIEIGSNCKNIAVEFAKRNRVLYVNPPIDRFTAIKRRVGSSNLNKKGLKRISNNLWILYPERIIESISRLPFNKLFDFLNKRNNKIFANDIKKAISQVGFTGYIHFCDSDMFRSFYLKELLKPKFYIYYTRDNLMAVKYWQVQGNRVEPAHMAKADLVVANSGYLANLASEFNSKSFFVGQGCDLSAFTKTKEDVPEDMESIQHPIIGYIGALKTLRLDIEIIEYIADKRPDWNIVLVGPEDDVFKNSHLHNKKNVWFLGRKDEKDLPAYLGAFDLAINPQTKNEITIGNYPRKIDEYLAMGKPVVGTKTLAMEYFKKFVSLAETKEDWVQCIDFEIKRNSKILEKQRIDFASQHSWENSVNQIYKHIREIEKV